MSPEAAEKLQNEIYRKMPAKKKIKIIFQIFKFTNKLSEHKVNFEEFLKPLSEKDFPLHDVFKNILKQISLFS